MENIDRTLTAVIMIGGQSRRIGGGIKSLIHFNNKSIFDRILERLMPQFKKIILNCNVDQEKFTNYDLPIIEDIKKGYLGPLAGIHCSMKWIIENDPQTEWLITFPGDTPFIPSNFVSNLKKKISLKNKIILVQSDNKVHPIIGAWHKSLFNDLDQHLNNGTRKILTWANNYEIDFINYNTIPYDPFFNINIENDLIEASKIEKNYINQNT